MTATITERTGLSAIVAGEIRAVLGRRGMNQTALAERLGRSQIWVSRRVGVNASVDMTLEEIAEMAKALEVPLEGLLYAITDSNREPAGLKHSPVTCGNVRRSRYELAA